MSLILLSVTVQLAEGATQLTVSTDKSSYAAGDTITISGKLLNPGDANTAVLQVYNTFNVLMQIGVINIAPDGTYTTHIKAEGSGWNTNGTYAIKVLYVSPPANAVASTTISFSTIQIQTAQPTVSQQSTPQTVPQQTVPQRSVPQSTPQATLPATPVQIPFWAKDTARKWHDGIVPNAEFGKVIQFMISSGLVKTSQQITSQDLFENIPLWVRAPAGWWSQGLISDSDFADMVQFLLNNDVIKP